MIVVFILIGAVIGMALAEIPGLVVGAALGALGWRVIDLNRQVRELRGSVQALGAGQGAAPETKGDSADATAGPAKSAEPPPTPSASESAPAQGPPAAPSGEAGETAPEFDLRAPASESAEPASGSASWLDQGIDWLRGFFFRGNPIVRIGVVVLFFGVAFLLKYAADQSLLPIEARLSAVAVGGLGLLSLGWWLRGRNAVFAMTLQGGAVGVLYLTVFAAARLYDVVPMGFAFAVMVALVALSAVLAVLQNAMALAAFGTAGGFLAPVLVSTGEGSHVGLFSYYALLNVGILGIAWFRAWRVLNLLGFAFTFVIGAVWGYGYYRPAYFASTEPFLVLFFLFFVAIAVLYAFRQPPRLKGYVDASLVFGVPLVAAGLQAALVRDYAFGMAYSAVVASAFYLVLASALWRSRAAGMRPLTEAFLALGVVFATLAVPLAFDGRWTAAAWALEGAGMIWVGIRQGRRLPRAFGAALQLGAGVSFGSTVPEPVSGLLVLNGFYVGCLVLSLGGWVSAFWAHRGAERLHPWERMAGTVLLYWGFLWWFAGGFGELGRALDWEAATNGAWLLAVASVAASLWLARRWRWPALSYTGAALLPCMLLSAAGVLALEPHLLVGWGWLPWLALAAVLYLGLAWFGARWPAPLTGTLHALGGWGIVLVLMVESHWLADRVLDAADTWVRVATVLPAIVAVFALSALIRRGRWPFARQGTLYTQAVAVPLAGLLSLWMLGAAAWDADPAIIGYLPLVNPLELAQAAVLLGGIMLYSRNAGKLAPEQRRPVQYAFAAMAFVGLTAVLARCVHHWAGVRYTLDGLWASALLQSTLSVFWTVAALGLMAFAARKGLRPVWFAGAALLALVLAKLFLVDLAGVGTVARIVSFLVVGGLMLVIGYFSPLPPRPVREGEP
ncbi:DUF2339 domain-containing protein [Ectothiorhodospiraceae bacterium WFHF3C12]|nr:DUF2339 domain-containing protein [Ectothiorhodospiraceae bacterium WFHF3C12]